MGVSVTSGVSDGGTLVGVRVRVSVSVSVVGVSVISSVQVTKIKSDDSILEGDRYT